jgi:hypothetical protein
MFRDDVSPIVAFQKLLKFKVIEIGMHGIRLHTARLAKIL